LGIELVRALEGFDGFVEHGAAAGTRVGFRIVALPERDPRRCVTGINSSRFFERSYSTFGIAFIALARRNSS